MHLVHQNRHLPAVTSDMQGEMNAYYDEVLLKYQDEPLSEDEKTMEVLKKRLNELHYVRPLPEDDGFDVPDLAIFSCQCKRITFDVQ